MRKEGHAPLLIVVAGPNGSGKTTITAEVLASEWLEDAIARRVMKGGHDVPIPKIISRYIKSIANCAEIAPEVDRLYVYDNSVENTTAIPLFRLREGQIGKVYVENVPEWATNILPKG